jgi:hypothetical protein
MVSRRALIPVFVAGLATMILVLERPVPLTAQPSEPAVTEPSQPKLKRLPRPTAPNEAKVIPGEVVVKYKDQFLPRKHAVEQRDKALKDAGKILSKRFHAEIIATYPKFGWVRIQLPPGLSFKSAVDSLMKDEQIEYARPNYEITLHTHTTPPPPDDWLWTTHFESVYPAPYPSYSHLWGLDKIGMEQAWSLSNSQIGGVVIAILDTGIDYDHPDILENYLSRISYCISSPSARDVDGHGTFVAGIIAARGNNGSSLTDEKFFVGVNQTATLMVIKIACGPPNIIDAINAVNYAVSHGATVINGSWGFYGLLETDPYVIQLKNEIMAGTNTTLYVASAGNEGRNFDACSAPTIWPQMFNLPNLIVVAATNPDDYLWVTPRIGLPPPCQPYPASNYGASIVHLAAPGENIWGLVSESTYTGNPIQDFIIVADGTSAAAPFVTGCAALLQSRQLQMHPLSPFTPQQLKSTLMDKGDPMPVTGQVASGNRLNCLHALEAVFTKPWPPIWLHLPPAVFEVPITP